MTTSSHKIIQALADTVILSTEYAELIPITVQQAASFAKNTEFFVATADYLPAFLASLGASSLDSVGIHQQSAIPLC